MKAPELPQVVCFATGGGNWCFWIAQQTQQAIHHLVLHKTA